MVGAGLKRHVIWLMLLLLLLAPRGAAAQEEGPFRVGVVVVDANGAVTRRCVAFAAESITGVELLEATDLEPVLSVSGGGVTLCALDDLGCPASDCFCECRSAPCHYWSYFHRTGEGWAYAGVGAATRRLRDGDVDAWVWGDGSQRPPEVTFAELCSSPETPVPEATPAPTPSPLPVAPSEQEGRAALDYLWFGLLLLLLGAGYLLLGRRR